MSLLCASAVSYTHLPSVAYEGTQGQLVAGKLVKVIVAYNF